MDLFYSQANFSTLALSLRIDKMTSANIIKCIQAILQVAVFIPPEFCKLKICCMVANSIQQGLFCIATISAYKLFKKFIWFNIIE